MSHTHSHFRSHSHSPSHGHSHSTSTNSQGDVREFVRRLPKQTAAQARANVQQQKESEWTWPAFFDSDPPPYEQLLETFKDDMKKSPLSEMLHIPPDDWAITRKPCTSRTSNPPVPKVLLSDDPEVPDGARQCAETLTRDLHVLEKRFAHYTQGPPPSRSQLAQQLHGDHTFAADLDPEEEEHVSVSARNSRVGSSPFRLSTSSQLSISTTRSSATIKRDSMLSTTSAVSKEEMVQESEDLVRELLDDPDAQRRRSIRARSKTRVCLLHTANHNGDCSAKDPVQEFPLTRLGDDVKPLAPKFNHRFQVEVQSMGLPSLVIEPFFTSVFLYDVTAHKRVSETFSCDLNKEMTMMLLQDQRPEFTTARGIAANCRKGIFCLSRFRPSRETQSVYLVVRVDKVLDGDVGKAWELYAKLTQQHDKDSKDPRVLDRVRENASKAGKRLGKYQTPFAIAAVPLKAAIEGTQQHSTVDLELWALHADKLKDEELSKLIVELGNGEAKAKRRRLGDVVRITASEITEEMQLPESLLTPTLQRVKPFSNEQEQLALEVQELPSEPVKQPHAEYKHLLYVYPLSANFSTTPYRNIACRVQVLDGAMGRPLSQIVVHGGAMVREAYTPVAYHNKMPEFHHEFKIRLPDKLTQKHHLLFTFFHVSCKDKTEPEVHPKVIGYSWFPLFKSRFAYIPAQQQDLPVCTELPSDDYFLEKPEHIKGAKWLDSPRKGVFKVSFNLLSTTHCPNIYIHTFLSHTRVYLAGRLRSSDNEQSIVKAIQNLHLVVQEDPAAVHHFLHVILRLLFTIIAQFPTTESTLPFHAFEALARAVALVSERLPPMHRSKSLETFLKYHFDVQMSCKDTKLHQDLAALFVQVITKGSMEDPAFQPQQQQQQHKDCHAICITRCWFFFEAIVRSAAEYLSTTGKHRLPASQRFEDEFYTQLHSLLDYLTLSVSSKAVEPESRARELCLGIAFFLRDLLTFADPTRVLQLLKMCMCNLHRVGVLSQATSQSDFRLNMLRVVASHEHYVALNLPVAKVHSANAAIATTASSTLIAPSPTKGTAGSGFRRRASTVLLAGRDRKPERRPQPWCNLSASHYLAHALVAEVCYALQHGSQESRYAAIRLAYDKLLEHSWDPRLQKGSERHAAVSGLYFPLALFLLEYKPLMAKAEEKYDSILSEHDTGTLPQKEVVTADIELTDREVRGLILIFLHIVKSCNTSVVRAWWSTQSKQSMTLEMFLKMLILSVHTLEYPGRAVLMEDAHKLTAPSPRTDRRKLIEAQYVGGGSSSSSVAAKIFRGSGHESPNLRQKHRPMHKTYTWSGTQSPYAAAEANTSSHTPASEGRLSAIASSFASPDPRRFGTPQQLSPEELEISVKMARNLSNEMVITVLDILELFLDDFVSSLRELYGQNDLMELVFQILISLLSTNLSVTSTQLLFQTLTNFVHKFPELLYKAPSTDYANRLCEHVLRQCDQSEPHARKQATAFLYLLMRKNYKDEDYDNFTRIKVQTTLALSKIVGPKPDGWLDVNLRRAWATIVKYAQEESDGLHKAEEFKAQVEALAIQLYAILRDTAQMGQFAHDPETAIDLHLRIADNYKSSPDLRITWLETLAKKQADLAHHAEAAQCYLQAAALVAEHLLTLHDTPFVRGGCSSFRHISPNVEEETAVGQETDESVCTRNCFKPNGFRGLIHAAVDEYIDAKMPECANKLLAFQTPILENQRAFEELKDLHQQISNNYQLIHQMNEKGPRYLGEYYRVKFFGAVFKEELNVLGYVYKEPGLTKLAEVSQRLEQTFKARYGDTSIDMIQDSKQVDVASLNPNKGYIQVTYLHPFLPDAQAKLRETDFERSVNINQFVYETPFTPSGKARGSLQNQYRRRTYVTVEHFFPYMKTRLPIVDEQWEELNPLEVAVHSITQKARDIEALTKAHRPNMTLLELQLRGSITVSVNEGPAEIARVFLSPEAVASSTYDPKLVRRLRMAFGAFLRACRDGLHVYQKQIQTHSRATDKQKEHLANLQLSFEELEREIEDLRSKAKQHASAQGPRRSQRRVAGVSGRDGSDA